MKMKKTKTKTKRFAHTPTSPKGLGDFYGQGIRAKIGRARDVYGFDVLKPKEMKIPPKSLA